MLVLVMMLLLLLIVVVVVVAKASSSSRASQTLTTLLKSDELTWLFSWELKLTFSQPCLQHRHTKIDQQKARAKFEIIEAFPPLRMSR